MNTIDTVYSTLDAEHRANLDGEGNCRCTQHRAQSGAAAGATEHYYPAPTRGHLPCQKRCLGTDGRLGIVALNYRSKVRRAEPLWVRRAHCAGAGDAVLRTRQPHIMNIRVIDVDGLVLSGEKR